MGNQNKVYIVEMRVYEDPQNPGASDYDVGLPKTISTAVFNPVTGECVQTMIDALRGMFIYIGKLDVPTADITQDLLNQFAQNAEHWPVTTGMTIIDGGDGTGTNSHDWRFDDYIGLWVDLGASAIAVATNTSLGVVQGSTALYGISVNPDGTMLVNGLADVLDGVARETSVQAVQTAVNEIGARVGEPTDAGSSVGLTIFSLLNFLVNMFVSFWTTTRAALLDRLDAAISSRAPAADTAALLARLTDTRAGYLDRLQTGVAAMLPRSRMVIGTNNAPGTVLSLTGRGILTYMAAAITPGDTVSVTIDAINTTTLSSSNFSARIPSLFIRFERSLVITSTSAGAIAHVALEF
jgi:hypothetical protein